MDKIKEITVEILKSIRDEIKHLRKDTNARFEQMDKRLEHIENDLKVVVSHFDRDYMLLANKVGELEGRFTDHISSHPH